MVTSKHPNVETRDRAEVDRKIIQVQENKAGTGKQTAAEAERRECTSRGSVQVEEGQSSLRKVRSWTWKCPKPLVDLTEEAEQEQEQEQT